MTYATRADIEARYPGELAQAGPRDGAGDLDAVAIGRALVVADSLVDMTLRKIGWAVPLADPAPDWVVEIAVDLALYTATPTALASQDDFADRGKRFDAALERLNAIARGDVLPPRPADQAAVTTVYTSSKPRVFGRGAL